MAIIRRVWGPYSPEELHPGTQAHELRWYFIGIRGDRTTAHWSLIYKPKERRFIAAASQIGGPPLGKAAWAVQASLPKDYPVENVNPDAFLDDQPVEEGKISDILKKRLSPADIARCTSLGILNGSK